MSDVSYEYIECGSIDLPDCPTPSVGIVCEVPKGQQAPSETQRRGLAGIRREFPQHWRAAMAALQERFRWDADDEGQVAERAWWACVALHHMDEEQSDTDFFWSISLQVPHPENWRFWEAHFHGSRFDCMLFYP